MRPTFAGVAQISGEEISANIAYSTSLGIPLIQDETGHGRKLAVVGGGPSIAEHLDEIKEFPEIWAINGTHTFLRERGIESTMITVDAGEELGQMALGAKKAIVATRCNKSVFDSLKGAEVRLFHLFQDGKNGVMGGSSTATCAFHLAVNLGYRDVTIFGCESSFAKTTHAYRDEKRKHLMLVKCNGGEYLTSPDFYIQAQELAQVIKMFSRYFRQVGGGLLGAMVENDDHDVTKMSRALWQTFGVPCTS